MDLFVFLPPSMNELGKCRRDLAAGNWPAAGLIWTFPSRIKILTVYAIYASHNFLEVAEGTGCSKDQGLGEHPQL